MNGCPGCGHAPHAGRCFFVAQDGAKLIPCYCKVKREIPDDGDTVLDARGDGAGDRPVAEPRRELARLEAVLADTGEDVLSGIRGIGRTMTEGAARMRGEGL